MERVLAIPARGAYTVQHMDADGWSQLLQAMPAIQTCMTCWLDVGLCWSKSRQLRLNAGRQGASHSGPRRHSHATTVRAVLATRADCGAEDSLIARAQPMITWLRARGTMSSNTQATADVVMFMMTHPEEAKAMGPAGIAPVVDYFKADHKLFLDCAVSGTCCWLVLTSTQDPVRSMYNGARDRRKQYNALNAPAVEAAIMQIHNGAAFSGKLTDTYLREHGMKRGEVAYLRYNGTPVWEYAGVNSVRGFTSHKFVWGK